MTDLAAFSGAFADLPRELLPELSLSRSAVRTDCALVVFNWVDPSATLPLHDHPFDQLALILAGRCVMRVDEEEHPLGPGGFVYIPSGARHGLEVVGSEPVLNVDVFSPAREDYLHLAEGQPRG
jgi:mannose-6-phosphate isomerase-like protein (cupin superfamily)